MTIFRYRAITADGRVAHGQIDAHNPADLEMRLQRMGLDLIRGEPTGSHERSRVGGRVPRRELIAFCVHLEQLLRAGVPIVEGLAELRDSIGHPRLRATIAGVIESIAGGDPLSTAMGRQPRAFDPVFVSLIRAGECGGRLPDVLRHLTESLKLADELAAHTRTLLIYPCFVGGIVLAATIFLLVYLVPQLKPFLRNLGHDLPTQTRLLFFVADTLAAHWHLALLLALAATIAAAVALRASPAAQRAVDGLKLRLPLLGTILHKIILSRFADIFALLYAAGIPVLDALRTTREVVGNRQVAAGLARVERLIADGHGVTQAFASSGLFPPLVIRMLRVGEGSGALDQALANVSYFYNRDVREAVGRAQAMLEPLLTVLLGGILGWIMLSVLGPVYDAIGRVRI
ncbi:type II secretion system F family protein [Azospira restricta]|uniref:Type II secretion system F family protein n=1 Tax=Azospira restricta TaxID=404405 RepID=A0A974SNT2_9RHOO|nr:type II secretion system F family protein [Azospira restricta]QRJ63698.1 type II secretion system F family protein [Azospira restricta]